MTDSTTKRDTIIDHIDQFLEASLYSDYCVNGIQVEGSRTVSKVASAVSCSAEVFEQAVAVGADLLLVHHGLFWKGSEPGAIAGPLRERLRILIEHDITLAAYHLPLDGHQAIGNNALIAEALEATPDTDVSFATAGSRTIGCIAELPAPQGHDELAVHIARVTGQHPTVVGANHPAISRIAICSGGGASYLHEAVALGADALITGEAREPTMAEAQELGVTVYAAGHWATEVFGVRALGEHLARTFELEHTFISVPNPV